MRMKIKRWLVVSDLQVPYQLDSAIINMKKMVKREKFDAVLVVGDEMDFQTISRFSDGTCLLYTSDAADE